MVRGSIMKEMLHNFNYWSQNDTYLKLWAFNDEEGGVLYLPEWYSDGGDALFELLGVPVLKTLSTRKDNIFVENNPLVKV